MSSSSNKTLPLPFSSGPEDPVTDRLDLEWPDGERFPLNTRMEQVRDALVDDLHSSVSSLLVTGYASLDNLIDLIAESTESNRIRIVIGSEPFESRRESFRHGKDATFQEMEAYWEKGISLFKTSCAVSVSGTDSTTLIGVMTPSTLVSRK